MARPYIEDELTLNKRFKIGEALDILKELMKEAMDTLK